MNPPDDPEITITYLATPVAEVLELQESLDGYQREIQLAGIGSSPEEATDADGPLAQGGRFVDMWESLASARADLHDQACAARDRGDVVVDLVARFPAGSEDMLLASPELGEVVFAAAQEGALLVPPLRPLVRHLQRWMSVEIASQLAGHPPRAHAPPA